MGRVTPEDRKPAVTQVSIPYKCVVKCLSMSRGVFAHSWFFYSVLFQSSLQFHGFQPHKTNITTHTHAGGSVRLLHTGYNQRVQCSISQHTRCEPWRRWAAPAFLLSKTFHAFVTSRLDDCKSIEWGFKTLLSSTIHLKCCCSYELKLGETRHLTSLFTLKSGIEGEIVLNHCEGVNSEASSYIEEPFICITPPPRDPL